MRGNALFALLLVLAASEARAQCTTSRLEWRVRWAPGANATGYLATITGATGIATSVMLPNVTEALFRAPVGAVLPVTLTVAATAGTLVGPASPPSMPNYPFGDAGDQDGNSNLTSADYGRWRTAFQQGCTPKYTP